VDKKLRELAEGLQKFGEEPPENKKETKKRSRNKK
jgi:hypothetical protein